MTIKLSKPNHIRVHSGMEINLLAPHPDTILIEDIAHGLANICRFGGHTKGFYSVADHSIWCSNLAEPGYKLEALLHDSPETYLGDVTRPLKDLLPDYKSIENRFMKVIAKKFNVPFPMSREVKRVDDLALKIEWQFHVLRKTPKAYHDSEQRFLHRFHELTT